MSERETREERGKFKFILTVIIKFLTERVFFSYQSFILKLEVTPSTKENPLLFFH